MNTLRRSLSFALLAGLPGMSFVSRLLFPSADAQQATDPNVVYDARFTALIDTFIPADETPGAIDLGLERPLLKQLRSNPKYFGEIVQMLESLNARSEAQYGEEFEAATLAQRTVVVSDALRPGRQSDDISRIISSMRARSLTAFYSSDAAFKMLDYHPPSQGGYPDYARPPV